MNKILLNKNIVLTRAEHQSIEDIKLLEDLGANVILFPTIKVQALTDYSGFDKLLYEFQSFDYLIFTSANAVTFFAKRVNKLSFSINYNSVKVIAVGKKTAETCNEHNIDIDLIPDIHTSEGILKLMKMELVTATNVLIPCSLLAKDELKMGLQKMGAKVYKVPIYAVTLPSEGEISANKNKLKDYPPNLCIFTSPSTYKNYLRILGIDPAIDYFKNIKVAAIGTVTQEAIEKSGVTVDIVPKEFNMISLVNSISEYYSMN